MLAILGFLFSKGLERNEIRECEIWSKQSIMFKDWYSTDWQKEQCSMYNINLK